MANYLSIIKQLERGAELCAYCGKDITDAPDCLHDNPNDWSYTAHHQTYATGPRALKTSLFNAENSMRIGMELLLDIPYLRALPLCDPDPFLLRRWSGLLNYIEPEYLS